MRRILDLKAIAPAAISCKLSADDLAERGAAWASARAHVAVVGRSRFPGGFRIVVQGRDEVLADIARLVAAERECCGWANWELETTSGQTALTVSGDEELIAPLAHALLTV